MKHFSLLIATPELLKSPLLQAYATEHDQVVTTATKHVLQFRLRNPLLKMNAKSVIYINYDNERLEVCAVSIVNPRGKETSTTVVACVIPREVGTTEFTFSNAADAKRPLTIIDSALLGNSMVATM